MNTQDVLRTLDYIHQFSGETIVIKLGGAALEDAELVKAICADLTRIRQVGISIVLVHGGGPAINEQLTRQGISWSFHEGQRITTPEMMQTIEATLSGLVNRRIVRALNTAGVCAVGFSGIDAGTLHCQPAHPVLGQVGLIDHVETQFINSILAMKDDAGLAYVPVIAPIGLGANGESYNINADWAAAKIASALGVKKLFFLTDQAGILDGNKALLSELDATELETLIEAGVVTGGMLAKARTILHALKNQVRDVHIFHARQSHGLVEELFTERGVGTVCRVRSRLQGNAGVN